MSSLFSEIKSYVQTTYDISRLDITEKIIRVTSLIIQIFIFVMLSSVVLFVLSFALANYLDNYWNDTGLGFLAVTGFYIIILLIFIIFRKALIIKPLSKILIKHLLNNQSEEENENDDI